MNSWDRQRPSLGSSNGKNNYALKLGDLGREMSVQTIMFHSAVAERLGLNATDHRCFDYILRMGGVTAGQLSRETGLTSGAITGVIDRLEKTGFARRQADPKDRRKVVIMPRPERLPEMQKLFAPLSRHMGRVMSNYSSRDSEVIVDFMKRVSDAMRQANLKIRSGK